MAGETDSATFLDLDSPTGISLEEFENLKSEVSFLSEAEAAEEWLESCRYGEVDVLRVLLSRFPSLTSYSNPANGNTGLHMAAANGHLNAVEFLVSHKHKITKNSSGNTPLHWAASNGKAEVVKFFTSDASLENIDVLEKNNFGRSALTEGFASQQEGVVEAMLVHDSASEDKLLSVNEKSKAHVVHELFSPDNPLLIRELAIENADNPFADSDRPDQDTTGLSIWSASIVLAQWLKLKSWEDLTVLELGAGCAVPGLVVASTHPSPRKVYLSDLNPQSVENIEHNIHLNNAENAHALRMDWCDKSTWPKEKMDVVIGSDLIYQKSLVPLLAGVVTKVLRPGGTFFYVAPDTGRDGLDEFIQHMKSLCPNQKEEAAPSEYHSNPLANGDDEECFLHFQELSSQRYILYEFTLPNS